MTTLAGYTVNNIIYSDENTFVAHALSVDNHPVLVKYQNTDFPSLDLDTRWTHEFDVLNSITSNYVINAQKICKHNNNPLLVLEYFPSIPLSELIKNDNLKFEQKIYISHQLTLAIGEIHRHQMIHRGLTPQSVLVNPKTLSLKICDVGSVSRLDKESQLNPINIWGALEYVPPELTGRTNLDVDYRCDFYSLGIMLYEIFHGQPPFISEDPLALLHAHIASMPTTLDSIYPEFPQPLSNVIQKLLAKDPTDRYQSSHGLQADVKLCLERWKTQSFIHNFPLAKHDIPERFSLAQKSYGREEEQTKLIDLYQQVSNANIELVFVSGDAGIGKSELTRELHKHTLTNNGLLISGKCNQYNQNQPYSVLIQAFSTLAEELLSKNSETQQHWRQTLNNALGNNAAVITEIIPDLALILGDIPAFEPLPNSESEQRLHITFTSFVKALSTREHPLVLLLDDLQWVDHSTLKLLTQLIINDENMSLFIVGAYRCNDVNSHHLLSTWKNSLSDFQQHIHTLHLKELHVDHIQQLLIDTLQCDMTRAAPLAELCFEKTRGNPFFVKQFLYGLH
ncbi:MAG: AAA family ATPase, partial [Pseudomonadales bacterium]|nr:AAA family ATPase [Pseudomonadales bacterium]